MKKEMIGSAFIREEQRSIKLFLWIFYTISIAFDIFYYYFLPIYSNSEDIGFPEGGLGFWIYLFLFALLPVAVYYIKNQNPFLVKYLYFISYVVINIINEIMIYAGSNLKYASGNVVEIFFILFSPIFVNKRYFQLVFLGLIVKYCIIGLVLQTTVVFLPIVLLVVLSILAFILLNRFQGYVNTVSETYDQQLEKMVKGLIAILELKDPYTRGHSERVAEYALILAKATKKFSKEELNAFNYSCLLHDIGKVHIPDQILTKPARLTNEEYEIIKTHPVVGAEAIKNVEGLSQYIDIDIIRYHHERWDGKGYPDQLGGDRIPLVARITAIADAFDAMTSSRSYRKALPLDEAYKRVIEGKGTQFDPDLVELFQEVYPQWVEVYYRYPWHENSKIFSLKDGLLS
jgi:hypothetical protein